MRLCWSLTPKLASKGQESPLILRLPRDVRWAISGPLRVLEGAPKKNARNPVRTKSHLRGVRLNSEYRPAADLDLRTPTMDDLIEEPSVLPVLPTPRPDGDEEDDENSSGDEDGGLDWTKLPTGLARPVIPKRGEKDFEPSAGGGSGLQLHVLDRARLAMFEALKATRNISSKSVSYGTWHPGISRAHVTLARGIHFTTMGHSVPRPVPVEENGHKTLKRLELLPEEAIYLIERGALFCWKNMDTSTLSILGVEDIGGSPMTVQQAFAEMIGHEDLTLEKYQVYAYLKRLGYVVMRTEPPTPSYPIPVTTTVSTTFKDRIFSTFQSWLSKLKKLFTRRINWWFPVRVYPLLHHNKTYVGLFKSLRFMSSGHKLPLKTPKQEADSPYKIFFNLYKPSTPFRKTAPPPPDFSIVVINARTTPMPTLQELTSLFDVLPELPPPMPRRRQPPVTINQQPVPPLPETGPLKRLLRRLFPWITAEPPNEQPQRKPHPFMALKAGKKTIVIAAVDAGSVSFFRFGQGAFDEWPMI